MLAGSFQPLECQRFAPDVVHEDAHRLFLAPDARALIPVSSHGNSVTPNCHERIVVRRIDLSCDEQNPYPPSSTASST
jgi:hypothetical protein